MTIYARPNWTGATILTVNTPEYKHLNNSVHMDSLIPRMQLLVAKSWGGAWDRGCTSKGYSITMQDASISTRRK